MILDISSKVPRYNYLKIRAIGSRGLSDNADALA